jgi:thiamine pyrophosphokinase
MSNIIVQTSKNVTLVGAGRAGKGILRAALVHAPYLVAADGGAELVLNYGKTPKKVIGDFDSIPKAVLAKIPVSRQHRIAEQDSTDFEKCLRSIRAPLILGVGFLGRRLDHQLAALSALVRNAASPCVLLGKKDVVFHLHGAMALDLEPGSRLSLFPLRAVRGTSQGLEWPIDGLEFAPGGRIGTSNRVLQGPVRLAFDGPGMLVILPRAALGTVVDAFGSAARAG